MSRNTRALCIAVVALGVTSASLASSTVMQPSTRNVPSVQVAPGDSALVYLVSANGAKRIREVTGPVVADVQGVPARPVDSFAWDGEGVREIDGEIAIEVDPVNNVGAVIATWEDEHGSWRYVQTRFLHPHHISGVRIGPSVEQVVKVHLDPIAQNVYIHGDTAAGQPVLPTLFALLAGYGPARVELNGEPFANPYEIPAPLWAGHFMVSVGARGSDGAVRAEDGSYYEPSKGSEGATDPNDLEVHLVFHDERFPVVPENTPPLFDFFYHLIFENVTIEIVQSDDPFQLRP